MVDRKAHPAIGLDDKLRAVQKRNKLPNFGDSRITYGRIDNDQLIYVDELPRYARAIGPDLPLSEAALYESYLLNLEEIERMTEMLETG